MMGEEDACHIFGDVRAYVSLRVQNIGQVIDALKAGGAATCLASGSPNGSSGVEGTAETCDARITCDPTHVICTTEDYEQLHDLCMRSASFSSWPHFVTSDWVFQVR